MKFIFRAKDQEGALREGTIDAMNQESAVDIIQKNGFIPVSIEPEKKVPKFIKDIKRTWEGVTKKELAIFFRQLATLIEAKVPITQALSAIGEQSANHFMRIIIKEISDDVQEGMPFSESLAKHGDVFEPLICNIVKAGEVSGNLQQSISFVATSIEKNYQLVSKIRGALLYPAFVISVALIVGFLVITIILPKLTGVIKELAIEVPWYTKVVMWVGDFMSNYWWAVLIVFFGIIGGFIYYIKTESGRHEWDQAQLKLPVVGTLMRSIYLARMSDNLALMTTAGIPIVRALTVVSDVIGNSVYQAVILKAADEVKTGGHISSVLMRAPEIPPIVAQMVRIGEETGKLGEVLNSVTKFYEQEVEKISRNLTTLIEPVMIVILGLGVAVLVFAVLLPIYNIAGKL
jgi:type IV pilus assembly protein PilC